MSEQRVVLVQDDEIDISEYFIVIARHWRRVIAPVILAALLGLAYTVVQPPSYSAKATVAITKPPYSMNFDERMPASDTTPPARALLSLATTDSMMDALLLATPYTVGSRATDGSKLVARVGSDPTLVDLEARGPNPAETAALANAWANALVSRARDVYGQGQGDVSSFEATLADADARLTSAQAKLADFQSHSELDVERNRLTALQTDQQAQLADRDALAKLIVDIQTFREQAQKYAPDARVTPGDELTAFVLQGRAFNDLTSSASSAVALTPSSGAAGPIQLQIVNTGGMGQGPIQFQVASGDLRTDKKVADLSSFLESLEASVRRKTDTVAANIERSTPQILELQGHVQRLQNEADRLVADRDLTKDTYQILARKTEEARIAVQGIKGQIMVASSASVPKAPVSAQRVLIGAIAGALGLILGLALAALAEWQRRQQAEAQQSTQRGAKDAPVGGSATI